MKHKIFIILVSFEIGALFFLSNSAMRTEQQKSSVVKANQQIVRDLMLTDLALWTESRYTRHPSQADFFAPFQDFPSAVDRFPAGSITSPGRNFSPAPTTHEREETGIE